MNKEPQNAEVGCRLFGDPSLRHSEFLVLLFCGSNDPMEALRYE